MAGMGPDYDIKNIDEQQLSREIKGTEVEELKKFNWGACGFTWFWLIFNGALKDKKLFALAVILFVISFVKVPSLWWLVKLAANIFMGIKGNKLSYTSGIDWADIEVFSDIQKKWGMAFVVAAFISGIGLILKIIFSF